MHMLYTYGKNVLHEILLNTFQWRWMAALEFVIDSFAVDIILIKLHKSNLFVGVGIGLRTEKHKKPQHLFEGSIYNHDWSMHCDH